MNKKDVRGFALNLENNLFVLHEELKNRAYNHGGYISFSVNDPKRRHIHKASVRDRVLHHAVYRVLYPIFDKGFIYDSYSCRNEKGTHRAIAKLDTFVRKVSRNHVGPCFVLKCDIRKYFDSIDHVVLLNLITKKIKDEEAMWLIRNIVGSFSKTRERERESKESFRQKGIPLGNLTSQLFANIYLNELDQFVKHNLQEKYYIRYCDDFLLIANDADFNELSRIRQFLDEKLKLELHPRKISTRKVRQGIDFLGYVTLPHYRALRTRTKKRMFKKLEEKRASLRNEEISLKAFRQTTMSCLGHCSHAKTQGTQKKLKRIYREEYEAKIQKRLLDSARK